MGLNSSCFKTNKTIDVTSFREKEEEIFYTIILKAPHGKKTYFINYNNWYYDDDINGVLKILFANKIYHSWLIYNDEGINKTCSTGAHAKGILTWNDTELIWIIHSVPKYPKTYDGTYLPDIDDSELIYGQSFVYLKLNINKLNEILEQIHFMHPNIYLTNYNYTYKNKTTDTYKKIELSHNIFHISKTPHYHKDFYDDIIRLEFGGNIQTETWVRGNHCIDSENCKMIQSINWHNDNSGLHNTKYDYKNDHSKFCISDNKWVLIGDLNRMTTQLKRGGGGILFKNIDIYNLFCKIINTGDN
jgi:deoxyribonuclease-2